MYTWMKSSRNGRRSISYPITDKADQKEERIGGMYCGGGLIDTGNAEGLRMQFAHIWDLAGRDRLGSIQTYKRVISFSENEISPDDPDWADKAISIGIDIFEKLMPDTLYYLVAQKDGKGGKVHLHGVNNAVHTSTLKALSGRETSKSIFQRVAEEVAEEHGIELDAGKDHSKRKKKEAKKKQEHQKETEGYSWMEDLQERITLAAAQTTATGDFEENLRQHGVTVSRKSKTGWTFVLDDCPEPKYKGKKCRYDKFPEDFSMKTLNKQFKANYEAKEEEEQKNNPDIMVTDAMLRQAEENRPVAVPRTGRRLPDIDYPTGDGDDFQF